MNLNPITWPGNALRLIARLVSDGLNQTRPVTIIQEYPISTADVDLALVPKGQGALIASTSDGTITGGNKRGTYATDLQRNRSLNSHVASASNAVICGGRNNAASATDSVVCGGLGHSANGTNSFIAGGAYGVARTIIGCHVFPACNAPISTTQGTTQAALLLVAVATTDATPTILRSNTAAATTSNQVTLAANSAYFFRASVIAGVTGAGNTKAWEFRGAIKRGATAASTTLVGTVIKDIVASDAGITAWDVSVTADTTNGALAVTVTGAAATTIRWVCKIETTEMTY